MKIVSGGQTGVDRGALLGAMEAGVPAGGWCPAGRKAEDGSIPAIFPVQSLEDAGYSLRTFRNVLDSDATLVLYSKSAVGGTLLTINACRALNRPMLLIDANAVDLGQAIATLSSFLSQRPQETVLNVAGPRRSEWPQGEDFAKNLLLGALRPGTQHAG